MITGYDELELCRRRFEHVEHGLVLGQVADVGDVACMEEYICLGKGKAVGVGSVGGNEGSGGVGIGDDEEPGADGFDGHDSSF